MAKFGTEARLKGQEVEVRVTQDGAQSLAFTAVASFSDTTKFEKKEDGFIGETTNRYDDIFNGYDGSLEMQVSNQQWMEFQAAVKLRATREQPNIQFNFVRTDFYANGDTPSRTYMDVKFGGQPTAIASRGDFVKVTIDFSCSDVADDLQGVL